MLHRFKSPWPWTWLLSVLLCVAAFSTAWELGRLAIHVRYLAHELLPTYESAHGLATRLERMRQTEYARALASNSAEQERLTQQMASLHEAMVQELNALERRLSPGSADLDHLRAVRTALNAYALQEERLRTPMPLANAATRLALETTQRHVDEVRAALDAWRADDARQAREQRGHVDSDAERALLGLLGVVGLALLLASGAVAGAGASTTRVDPERWASF